MHSGDAEEDEAATALANRPRRQAAVEAVDKVDRCRQIEKATIDERPGMLQPAAPSMEAFPVGHRVMARYQATTLGKLTRFYPGMVRAVHTARDGFVCYDIDYDDGDHEIDVREWFVRERGEDCGKLGQADFITALIESHESPAAKRAAHGHLAEG